MNYNLKNHSLMSSSGHYRPNKMIRHTITPETAEPIAPSIELPKNNNIVGGELNDFQKKLSNLTITNNSNQSNSIHTNNLPGSRKKNINFIL
jgi:hypothetical protein